MLTVATFKATGETNNPKTNCTQPEKKLTTMAMQTTQNNDLEKDHPGIQIKQIHRLCTGPRIVKKKNVAAPQHAN